MINLYNCDLTFLDIGKIKKVICTGKCFITGKPYSVVIEKDSFDKICLGESIQDVLINISNGDKEFLISGVSPDGWEVLFDSKSPYYIGHNIVTEKSELEKINLMWKKNWQEFKQLLIQNNIKELYHFTDRSNIQSIKDSGGLFSWGFSNISGIQINISGGDELSKQLDKKAQLHDYVRLSFVQNHPMQYVQKNRVKNPIIIRVNRDVCFFEETVFSNINATSRNVKVFKDIHNFRNIRFNLFSKNYLDLSMQEKQFYQAEVMVKTHIPLKYLTIPNI